MLCRSSLIVVLAMGCLLAITAPASAEPDVTLEAASADDETTFELNCLGPGCRAVVRVYAGRTRLLFKQLEPEEFSDYESVEASYKWSCGRTGRLRWTVTVTGYEGPEDAGGVVDTSGNGVATGFFTVPRCTKSKPRRVRRGYVASSAAAEYEDEFVSRSVCSPLTRVVNGKASSWRCNVVHNNTYRQCSTTLRMRYTQRLKFGTREYKEHVKRLSTRCRSF